MPTTTAEPPSALAVKTDKPGVFTLELPRETLQRLSDKMPEGVVVLVCPPEHLQPEFIRLPPAGEKCPVTGLPRSTLLELLEQAGSRNIPVRHLRKPGATTGIALIPRQKLIDYINTLPAPEWQPEGEEE